MFVKRFAALIVVLFTLVSVSFAQEVPEILNISNWSASWDMRRIRRPVNDFVYQTEQGLKLMGSYGTRDSEEGFKNDLQYALSQKLSAQFSNKTLKVKFIFDGIFPKGEGDTITKGSFIGFGLRASDARTSLKNQSSYVVLIRERAVQLVKLEKGRAFSPPEAFRFEYLSFPELGFETFPVGQEVELSFSAIDEGTTPRLIIKINGVEMANVLDNKWGAVVKTSPRDQLIIALQGTNNHDANDLTPKSSIVITSLVAE